MKNFLLEGPGGIPGLSQIPVGGSATTKKNWVFDGSVTFNGGANGITADVAQVINDVNANAFAVGPNGTTNPTFNVDTSTTSAATGINIKSAAAAGGVAVSVLSSGTNEGLTVDGKGSGTIGLNTVSTTAGLVTIGNSTAKGGATVQGPLTGVSASASALAIGLTGATNPAFSVDASTAVQAAGLNVKGAATGGTVALAAIDSGSNTSVTLDGKGTGTLGFNTVSTTSGLVTIGNATALGGVLVNGPSTVASAAAAALAVGANGATNPAFNVDASTATSVTGVNIKSAASGGGVALSVISSNSNESLSLSSKGTGFLNLQFGGVTKLQITSNTVTTPYNLTILSASSATAGGAEAISVGTGAGGVLGVYWGSGAPTISAGQGSLYLRTDGASGTRAYINNSSGSGTTWTGITTAA